MCARAWPVVNGAGCPIRRCIIFRWCSVGGTRHLIVMASPALLERRRCFAIPSSRPPVFWRPLPWHASLTLGGMCLPLPGFPVWMGALYFRGLGARWKNVMAVWSSVCVLCRVRWWGAHFFFFFVSWCFLFWGGVLFSSRVIGGVWAKPWTDCEPPLCPFLRSLCTDVPQCVGLSYLWLGSM